MNTRLKLPLFKRFKTSLSNQAALKRSRFPHVAGVATQDYQSVLRRAALAGFIALTASSHALADSPQDDGQSMVSQLETTPLWPVVDTDTPLWPAVDTELALTEEELNAHIRSYLMEHPEVIIEALQVLKTREAVRAATADQELITGLQSDLFSPALGSSVVGNPDGTRTLVEFVDYQCGYCKRVHATTTAMLAADPELRIIYKELPILGPQSVIASKLLIAATRDLGPAFYQPLSDALFELRGTLTAQSLPSVLDHASISPEQKTALTELLVPAFDDIQADPELTKALERNARLAQALSISGTPGFVGPSGIIRGAADAGRLSAIAAPQE